MLPNTLYAPLATGMLPTATLPLTFPVPVGAALVLMLVALAVSGVILGLANRPIPGAMKRGAMQRGTKRRGTKGRGGRLAHPRIVRPLPNQA